RTPWRACSTRLYFLAIAPIPQPLPPPHKEGRGVVGHARSTRLDGFLGPHLLRPRTREGERVAGVLVLPRPLDGGGAARAQHERGGGCLRLTPIPRPAHAPPSPNSLFPTPNSLLPTPYSPFPVLR